LAGDPGLQNRSLAAELRNLAARPRIVEYSESNAEAIFRAGANFGVFNAICALPTSTALALGSAGIRLTPYLSDKDPAVNRSLDDGYFGLTKRLDLVPKFVASDAADLKAWLSGCLGASADWACTARPGPSIVVLHQKHELGQMLGHKKPLTR
jgi:hypothetical protein